MVVLVANGAASRAGALDPDNPDPDGAQALARVLDDQGVDVTVVRDADALEAEDVAGTTVLVTSTDLLGESTIERLRSTRPTPGWCWSSPAPAPPRRSGCPSCRTRSASSDPRPARCTDPTYAGLSIEVDQAWEYPVEDGCFGGRHGALLAEPQDGLVLLGADQALTNDQVLRADNAAVALRLLGQDDRLVWYVPSLDDLVGDDGVSLADPAARLAAAGACGWA